MKTETLKKRGGGERNKNRGRGFEKDGSIERL